MKKEEQAKEEAKEAPKDEPAKEQPKDDASQGDAPAKEDAKKEEQAKEEAKEAPKDEPAKEQPKDDGVQGRRSAPGTTDQRRRGRTRQSWGSRLGRYASSAQVRRFSTVVWQRLHGRMSPPRNLADSDLDAALAFCDTPSCREPREIPGADGDANATIPWPCRRLANVAGILEHGLPALASQRDSERRRNRAGRPTVPRTVATAARRVLFRRAVSSDRKEPADAGPKS